MVESRLERIVIIHPHQEFDLDLKCKGFIDEVVGGFSGHNRDILVVRGYREGEERVSTDEKLEPYLDRNKDYQITTSRDGKINKSQLKKLIKEGATIRLTGGIVGQCHRSAFESMVEYIQQNNIHDVEFIIHLDGCYFQHSWVDWGNSWEKGPTKRFDGVFIGGYGYEMGGGDSYTLREVITKKFGELGGPHELHRKQMRDGQGVPMVADPETVHKNVTDYFFKGYFVMPRGQKIVTREYDLTVANGGIRIHIH